MCLCHKAKSTCGLTAFNIHRCTFNLKFIRYGPLVNIVVLLFCIIHILMNCYIIPIAGLWELLDTEVKEKRNVRSATANASVETTRYLTEPNIPRNEDPLLYWAKHKHVYPHLYVLARNLLCIPASSVPCERVFSKAGEVI